jgi:hypothetical protein
LNQDEINELQRYLADAVTDKLPPGWTFLLCAIAPDGQRYFSGSVQATELGKKFISDLEASMDVQVWRIPPKRLPTKVTTPTADPHRPLSTDMTLRWMRDGEGIWTLGRNGRWYPVKRHMVENRRTYLLGQP